jgi:hypothetical protein
MARLSAVSQRRPGQAPEPVRALVQCADEDRCAGDWTDKPGNNARTELSSKRTHQRHVEQCRGSAPHHGARQ